MRVFPLPPHGTAPLLPITAENSSSDQRQACKKHELYVSFRDLGWQVRGRVAGSAPVLEASGMGSPVLPTMVVGLGPLCAVSRGSHLLRFQLFSC